MRMFGTLLADLRIHRCMYLTPACYTMSEDGIAPPGGGMLLLTIQESFKV